VTNPIDHQLFGTSPHGLCIEQRNILSDLPEKSPGSTDEIKGGCMLLTTSYAKHELQDTKTVCPSTWSPGQLQMWQTNSRRVASIVVWFVNTGKRQCESTRLLSNKAFSRVDTTTATPLLCSYDRQYTVDVVSFVSCPYLIENAKHSFVANRTLH